MTRVFGLLRLARLLALAAGLVLGSLAPGPLPEAAETYFEGNIVKVEAGWIQVQTSSGEVMRFELSDFKHGLRA